ncbi:MAG TPA: phenylalanine--tRNA ligase subunit alpha [Candidatus Omnitrophota bacterium]|nr:phenylalanine--tRNA ligase subunit alpha [Candidatus Omnitrophota bacterium]HPT07168.1 phenylalanine--tRNA ligase subunit alpha [Candidatus Omnitrophota bacterium]
MSGVDFDAIQASIEQEIVQILSVAQMDEFRLKYLGRKGILADLTGSIPTLPKEARGGFGQKVNALKTKLLFVIAEKEKTLTFDTGAPRKLPVDIGLPGIAHELGRKHPLTQVIEEITSIFVRMGFSVVDGPEIETEFNNFTGLNIPLEHPSRDAFDTFYLGTDAQEKLLLRSQTSPVQIRVMKKYKPPLAVIAPGRVYRPDAVDASHSFMFQQIEGVVVDKGITFSDLKGTLETFAKAVYGDDIKMRLRPHYFPFTEPSAEVDISCYICHGKGCSVCGRKGWLEILGAGMIHPNVFKNVGYGANEYTGFAFGMGVERIAMLKYGIDDIRLFYENDLRFLRQF